jgi:hypothetical protein
MLLSSKNISIITTTRSGSTYLANLLNNTDRFNHDLCLEELFLLENAPYKKFKKTVNKLISTEGGVIKDCIDWIWLAKPNRYRSRNMTKLFNNYIRFLHSTYMVKLVRDDKFEQILSHCISEIDNIWHVTKPLENRNIYISPDKFTSHYRTQVLKFKYMNKLFPKVDQIVNYKDLTFDPNIDINLFPGLKLNNGYKSDTIRMNPDKINIVNNYYELLELFNHFELGNKNDSI